MTISFDDQLAGFGFHRDPFAFPDAERIDLETLEETFVPHPGFNEHVMGSERSAVLLASSGAGKTAGRRKLEMTLKEHRRRILSGQQIGNSYVSLAASYNDFERLVIRLPNIDLPDHIAPLLATIATAVYGFIKEQLDHIMTTSQQEREWWCRFLRKHLEGEDITDWMLSSPLASAWQQTHGRGAPFGQNSTLASILNGLQPHLTGIGIDTMYVLVDGVDGYIQTQSLANLEILVRPLLNTLLLFSHSYIVWKFFLPSELTDLVQTSLGYQKGRLEVVSIQWNAPSLIQLLRQRIEWASNSRIHDIARLCDQQLLNTVNVELELVHMALRHTRLGPPRALLDLGSQLLRSKK
jgi:hypothetical protein